MITQWLLRLAVGLLPVLVFLGTLVYLDSYKLLKLRTVVAVVAAGVVTAVASWAINGALLGSTGLELATYSRYLAPLVEEAAKALVVIALIRLGRIAFLVDGAILGFAVGAGFSIFENAYYLMFVVGQDVGIGTWIIRGFGTAIMHGGATAVFAVAGVGMLEHRGGRGLQALAPGFGLAYVVHALYNHGLLPPIWETFVVMVTLPLLLWVVFRLSERSLGTWLGKGFDADAELLHLINSGQLTDAPLGQYISTLRQKFHGPIVADILCYVRIHTELAMRAKGLLMMRETGFDAAPDQDTRDKFAELRYLEGSIGRTGKMAIRPMLHLSLKDLRQLYLLEDG